MYNRPRANTPSNIPPIELSSVTSYYKKTTFTVSNSGPYYIYSGANYDNYLLLYQNYFVPSQPLLNIIAGNDDTTGTWMPEYTILRARSAINYITLNTGTNYILINTAFYGNSSGLGNWKDSIVGPGTVNILASVIQTGNYIPKNYSLSQKLSESVQPGYENKFRHTGKRVC